MPTSPDSQQGTNSVLEARAPDFTTREAESIAKQTFGLECSARLLVSERDQNFRLRTSDGIEWVLKIANPAEDPAILDMQTQALLHIAKIDPGLAIPKVMRTLKGAHSHEFESSDGRIFIIRMLSYLPGQLLEDAVINPALARDVGVTTARLARSLNGFFHPAARHELLWDPLQSQGLLKYTHYIKDSELQTLVEEVLEHFCSNVLPLLQKQRAQIIHNDISELNTLVDGQKVAGIIDFGDLIHVPLICDLAVPISELSCNHPDPIALAAEITAGYHSITPLEDAELRLIFDLVTIRCVMEIVIANWRVCDHPENVDYIMAGIPDVTEHLKRLLKLGPESMYNKIRRACAMPLSISAADFSIPAGSAENINDLVRKRQKYLGADLELSYDAPLHVVRGEGVWLTDSSGHSYLDAYNNVPQVGHCHPVVVQALARQAATLNTNTRYLYKSALEYSKRLTATMPDNLSVCMFVCSGSEANDLAWRLAKAHSKNSGIIVMEDAYHGTTDAVYEFSPAEQPEGRSLASHVAAIPAPDGYRGKYRRDDPQYVEKYAALIDDAISSLAKKDLAPAAFILDMICSSNGIIVPPPGYLSSAFKKIRAAGGLCIADEVQSGFGRTGNHFWGFSAHGVVPDIVTLGKPIGNGFSMAAVVTTPEIIASLTRESDFFSTTGGNPVACEVGLAVLDVLEQEALQENAERVGGHLKGLIRKLSAKHPLIGEVRGAGLFIGVELVCDPTTLEPAKDEAGVVANKMRELGVLVGIDGPDGNVLKIRPPLVFDANHARQLVEALDQALEG